MTTISVGGVTFSNEPGTEDGDGVLWLFSRFSGWHDGASVRSESTDRTWAHGSFQERAWRGGIAPTVRGAVLCPTRALASDVQRTLSGLLAEGTYEQLVVDDDDQGVLSASVRLAVDPVIDWDRNTTTVDYEFTFLSADPFRYAAPTVVTTGFARMLGGLEYDLFTDGTTDTGVLEYGDPGAETGMVEVTNTGTADAWTALTVTGPTPPEGFDILVAGERLRFSERILTGSTLVIDTATGTVQLDGVDRKIALTIREWRSVAPGESVTVAFVPLAGPTSGELSVSLASTFW